MRLAILGIFAIVSQAQQLEPHLFIRLAQGSPASAAQHASSNERIPLQICIQAKDVADPFERPRIEALNHAPGGPPANVKLYISRVNPGGRQQVAFRVNSSGEGKSLAVWWVDADVDLLEDKNVRLQRVKQFVDWMATQAANSPRAQLLQTPAGKDRMVSYFEEQYIANPPGEYEIVARYAASSAGNWKGELTSPPFRLSITNAGDFLDTLKAQLNRH